MAKRVLAFLVVLVVVATIGFVLFRIVPADPASLSIPQDPRIPPTAPGMEELRDIYSEPLYSQYIDYMYRTFTGQFGFVVWWYSGDYHVNDIIYPYVLKSFFLFGVTSILSILVGAFYIRRVSRKPSPILDGAVRWASAALFCLPVLAVFLLIRAVVADIDPNHPVSGFWSSDYPSKDLVGKIADILEHAILPMLILFLCSIGAYLLTLREGVAEAARQGGQDRKGVAVTMLSVAPYMPFFFSWVFMSSMVIDSGFNYFGLGYLLGRTVFSGGSFQLLEAIFFLTALIVMLSSLAFDLTAAVFVRDRAAFPIGSGFKSAQSSASKTPAEKQTVAQGSFFQEIRGISSDFIHGWRGILSLALLSVLVVVAILGTTVGLSEIRDWPPDVTKAFLSGSTFTVGTALVLAVLPLVIGLVVGVALGSLGKWFDWFSTTLFAALMAVPLACLLVPRLVLLAGNTVNPTELQFFWTMVRAVLTATCALVAVVVSRGTITVIEKHRNEWMPPGRIISLDRIVRDVVPRVLSDAFRAAKYAAVIGVLACSTASLWYVGGENSWGYMIERAFDHGAGLVVDEFNQFLAPMLGIALLCFTIFLMLDTTAQVLRKRYPD
jgi:peptide/nickel transport system permease protein